MRYQPIDSNRTDRHEVAAVWPSLEEALRHREVPEAAPEVAMPAAAVPDVPKAVGVLIVAPYAALLGVFFALFAGSATALFSIAICAVFIAVFFAVPRIFLAVEADPTRRPSLSRFWHQGMDTLTGHTSGRDALIQMLIVPVFLCFGLLTMGIVGKILIG